MQRVIRLCRTCQTRILGNRIASAAEHDLLIKGARVGLFQELDCSLDRAKCMLTHHAGYAHPKSLVHTMPKVWTISCALLVPVLVGCSDREPTDSASAPQTQPAASEPVACDPKGQPYCDIPAIPGVVADACSYLKVHLAGRQVGEEKIVRVESCEAPVLSAPSALGAAAAVATRLEVDGPPSHGAFLFVRVGTGWRVVDHLLSPAWDHGGYCKTRFRLRWEANPGKQERILDAISERICHMPLDQSEAASKESDIAEQECRHARYSLDGDTLEKLSGVELETPCPIE